MLNMSIEEYMTMQKSTSEKDVKIAMLNRDLEEARNEIDDLKGKLQSVADLKVLNSEIKVKEGGKEEGMRTVVEKLISYAENLPAKRMDEAIAIQTALSRLLSTKRIPNHVMTDELDERLDNIGAKEEKERLTQVSTGGGPAILGGNFDKIDIVAQKKIELK